MSQQHADVSHVPIKGSDIVCYCGLPEPYHDYTAVEHQTDIRSSWNPEKIEFFPSTPQGNGRILFRELLEKVRGKPGPSDCMLDYLLEEPRARMPESLKGRKVLWLARTFFDPQGREYARYCFHVPSSGWGWQLISLDRELDLDNGWFVVLYRT